MESTLNFFAVVNTLGAIQCILTAIALFNIKTGNRQANRFFAFFLISLAIVIIDFVMYDTRFFLSVPHLYMVLDPVVFTVGPLFYFYIKSMTDQGFVYKKKDWLHFLLLIFILLLTIPGIFLSSQAKINMYLNELNSSELTFSDYLSSGIINTQLLAYLFTAFRILNRSIKVSLPASDRKKPISIKWLRNLTIALIFVAILSAIFDFIPMDKKRDYNNYLTPLFITFIVYGMGYVGIRQSEIFTVEKLFAQQKKYEKSILTDKLADDILKKLKILMDEDKLYTDSLISLPKLADRLKITTHLLSQILNERLNRNFFNYINEYRVDAAKEKLITKECQQVTMLQIALDVGFNSLSVFNSAFKKFTGMSPSEYKKHNCSHV